MSATEIVRAQVEAFNNQDLEGFLATYSSDAIVIGVAPEPLVGSEQLRAFYEPRLQDTSLRCVLHTVLSLGERWVVARELITSSQSSSEVIATFDVVDGLIARASMLRA